MTQSLTPKPIAGSNILHRKTGDVCCILRIDLKSPGMIEVRVVKPTAKSIHKVGDVIILDTTTDL